MLYTIDMNDLDAFEESFYHLNDFIFRGQSNSEWLLEPKLDRVLHNSKRNRYEKSTIEKAMIEKCQKNAQLYIELLPEKEDYYSWFSLIQHYGGPTRFLDFSYSPYIALFFAINQTSSKNIALWCINKTKIWQREVDYYKIEYPDNWFGNFRYKTTDIFNNLIFDRNKKSMNSILLLDQKVNHQRIAVQQGAFLTSMDENSEFEFCLNSFLDIKEKVADKLSSINIDKIRNSSIIKYVINEKYYKAIAYKLKMINITSESLFPGFEGFVKSIYMDIS